MTTTRPGRQLGVTLAMALSITLLLPVLAGGEKAADASESRESLRDALAVQVLHRAARSEEGGLISGSRREALDEVAFAIGEREFLLEAWGVLVGGERVACLVLPGAEPLGDELEARAASAEPRALALRRVTKVTEIREGERVLVLAAPSWKEGRSLPELDRIASEVEERSGRAPRAYLLDLFESRVEGQTHELDMLLAAEHARAASLLVEYVLGARAKGAMPELATLFARHGVDRESVAWYRLALPLD